MPLKIDRLAKLALNALGHKNRIIFPFEIVKQDRELIAAEPGDGFVRFRGDRIGRPQAAAESIANGDQQPIPGRVAEAVIDNFESVQVQKKHGESEIGSSPRPLDTA